MTGTPPEPAPAGSRTIVSKLLAIAILLLMAPMALLGLAATPNEYRAMGVDAVDCDGPISVLIFAVPALPVYGVAAVMFLRRGRRFHFLAPGLLCALLSLGLLWNIGDALKEEWRNSAEFLCGSGL